MDKSKIKLEILGLSYSQTQTGAYALVLGESEGKRRLPIIIGNFEAQAIAIELEKMRPSRPLTHDIFKSFADAFAIDVKEVIIYNLVEGIFFARLVCQKGNDTTKELDTRTSDAIALAVRFKCPIYTYEHILSSAGIVLDEEIVETSVDQISEIAAPEESSLSGLPDDELEKALEQALSNEDYEKASLIRDEIKKRK